MAFESLTDKLQNVFKKLRSKGRLTEEDVKLAPVSYTHLPPQIVSPVQGHSVRWYHPALPVSPDMHPDTPSPGSLSLIHI